MRTTAVILIALLTAPASGFAEELRPAIPPAGVLRAAIAREAAGAAKTLAKQVTWASLQGLPVGSDVTLMLASGQAVTGTLVEIQSETVVLNSLDIQDKSLVTLRSSVRPFGAIVPDATPPTQTAAASRSTYPKSSRRWFQRHLTLVGTLAGTGVGVLADRAKCGRCGRLGYTVTGLIAGMTIGSGMSVARKSRLKYEASSTVPDVPAVVTVAHRYGFGEGIIVTSSTAQTTSGTVQGLGQDHMSVTPDGASTPLDIAYSDVRALRGKPSHRMLNPAVLGALAAGAVAAGYLIALSAP